MSVTLTLAGVPDTPKYHYQIVFNTSGNGLTPRIMGNGGNNLAAYSDVLEVVSGSVNAYAYLRPQNCPACVPSRVLLAPSAGQLSLLLSGDKLTIHFARSLFAGASNSWLLNAITTNGTNDAAIDSLAGTCRCYDSPNLPVSQPFGITISAKAGNASVADAARIVGVEITNTP